MDKVKLYLLPHCVFHGVHREREATLAEEESNYSSDPNL
jgi:hypothetical protein